ncbi:peptidase C14 caspase catalytic subunit p20 [Aeromonas sp. CA23]|uniref:caspase family protein n=1 Tax=Aeromonas sp. CA23 TaxID=2033032 RepID=UPI000BFB4B2F|nr:caspase family protein [Aeromonas sp. CA23]ATL98526.1 peptidase C14 caspase catalytic subunit p20 [Aeromonas sp. CA23]
MKSWAIVVGINDYPQQAGQRPLRGAVADACDFADWILDPQGGNVAPERLFFWTYPWPEPPLPGRLGTYLSGELPLWFSHDDGWQPPDSTCAPKAMDITSTIEQVGRTANSTALDDGDTEIRRIYVFLAGHGIRAQTFDRNEETCFLAGDFRPLSSNLAAGLVPCESFRKALLHNRFDEAILFTDCCRSETARLTLKAQPVSDYSGDPIATWGMAFAAQDGEPAYETQTPPVRGAFSSALMHGLRTYRPGPGGELHAALLRDFVVTNIKSYTNSGQVPNLLYRPDPDGPLIVTGSQAGGRNHPNGPLVDVSALANGTKLILNGGDNKPVPGMAPFTVTGPTLQLPPLAVGLYLIEIADGSGRYTMFVQPTPENVRVP